MKERLIELITNSDILCDSCGENTSSYCAEYLADYLLANGVMVVDGSVGVTNLKPLQTMCGMPLDEVAELITAKEEDRLIVPPCKVGEDVYFLVARGSFGSLVTSGVAIKRKVDEIGWNGKDFIIRSYRDMPNDPCGNLSSEWGNLVFATEEEADKRINEIREKCF